MDMISTLFRIRKTLLEMLTDRGYNLKKLANISIQEFSTMVENNNYDIIDDNNTLYVYFYKESKIFSKKDLENIVESIKKEYGNNINIIIILRDRHNETIRKELISDLYKNVELFAHYELIINIMHHRLSPTYVLQTSEEIASLLLKYKCKLLNFPKLLSIDPAARYYGLKPGAVVKIVRRSPASGSFISYRYVK